MFAINYVTGYVLFTDFLTYVQEDSSVLPRAAIITVSGLGGIVAGYRGQLRGSLSCNCRYDDVGVSTLALLFDKEDQ